MLGPERDHDRAGQRGRFTMKRGLKRDCALPQHIGQHEAPFASVSDLDV